MAELSKVLDDLYGEPATVETPLAAPDAETGAPTASVEAVSAGVPDDVTGPVGPRVELGPAHDAPTERELAEGELAEGPLLAGEPTDTDPRSGRLDPADAGTDLVTKGTDLLTKGTGQDRADADAPADGARSRRRTRAVARATRRPRGHAEQLEADLPLGAPLAGTLPSTPWTLSDDDILPLRRRLPGRR